jgi:hypothetical protein
MYYLDHEDHWHNFSYNMHDPNRCVGIHYSSVYFPMMMAKSTGIWTIDFLQDTVWHPMNNGLGGTGITEMASDYYRVFICQPHTGVSTFSAADSTWIPYTTNGLGTDYVSTLTFHDSLIVAGAFDGIRALRPPYEQWTPENTGLSAYNTIKLETYHDLIFASAYPRYFYVARSSSLEWHDRSDNLPEFTFIWDMFCDGSHVYAGTNRSLWKRTLGEMNPGIEKIEELSFHFFPNPCCDKIQVILPCPLPGRTVWTLSDILGKKLATGDLPPGSPDPTTWVIPVSGLSPGVYVLRVQNSGKLVVAKLIKE